MLACLLVLAVVSTAALKLTPLSSLKLSLSFFSRVFSTDVGARERSETAGKEEAEQAAREAWEIARSMASFSPKGCGDEGGTTTATTGGLLFADALGVPSAGGAGELEQTTSFADFCATASALGEGPDDPGTTTSVSTTSRAAEGSPRECGASQVKLR